MARGREKKRGKGQRPERQKRTGAHGASCGVKMFSDRATKLATRMHTYAGSEWGVSWTDQGRAVHEAAYSHTSQANRKKCTERGKRQGETRRPRVKQ